MEFDSVIRSVIESEIKNSAVPFKVDQFRLQRSMLEKYFHQKLKDRLEGIYINWPDTLTSRCFRVYLSVIISLYSILYF